MLLPEATANYKSLANIYWSSVYSYLCLLKFPLKTFHRGFSSEGSPLSYPSRMSLIEDLP